MKFLLYGYTGYCRLFGRDILLTSYSLSLSENIIKSDGASRILVKSVSDRYGNPSYRGFKRFELNPLRDYPGYELSISFDAQAWIFARVIESLCRTDWTGFTPVKFYDDNTGISYEFEDALVTSCQVSVDTDSVTTMSLSFKIFRDEIEIGYGDYDVERIRHAPAGLVGHKLMPYWAWNAEYPGFNDHDLVKLGFQIQRPVTPKFGCEGRTTEPNAVAPMKVVLGSPKASYELSYLMAQQTLVNDYEKFESARIAEMGKAHTLVMRYSRGRKEYSAFDLIEPVGDDVEIELAFTLCYPDSYSPGLANKGDANRIDVNGTVYGRIEMKEKNAYVEDATDDREQ